MFRTSLALSTLLLAAGSLAAQGTSAQIVGRFTDLSFSETSS
jgi:hypothetical protein